MFISYYCRSLEIVEMKEEDIPMAIDKHSSDAYKD